MEPKSARRSHRHATRRQRGSLASRVAAIGTLVSALLVSLPADFVSAAPTTRLVSRAPDGTPADGESYDNDLTPDARFVAFASTASNFSSEDGPAVDVFVWDRRTGVLDLISKTTEGAPADGDSYLPSISADGRYVAFLSEADNLSSVDRDDVRDIFLRDRVSNTTTLVSKVRASRGGSPILAADANSDNPSISDDGRYVAFDSEADNLSSRDRDGVEDVFLYDRETGGLQLVSQSSSGAGGDSSSTASSISGNGRFVTFSSYADNFSSLDKEAQSDVFIRDRVARTTRLVSRNSKGKPANGPSGSPSVSSSGRFVAFVSDANNLSSRDDDDYNNVFVRDMKKDKTRLVSRSSSEAPASHHSRMSKFYDSISASGRYVVFESTADNLSSKDDDGHTNVFVRDVIDGRTRWINRSATGDAADDHGLYPAISGNGRYVAFWSLATNLTPVDGGGVGNVFLRGPLF